MQQRLGVDDVEQAHTVIHGRALGQDDQVLLLEQEPRAGRVGVVVGDDDRGSLGQVAERGDGLALDAEGLIVDQAGGDQIGAVGGVEAVEIGGVLEVVGVQRAVLQRGVGQNVVVIDHDVELDALFGQCGLDKLQQLGVGGGAGADGELDALGRGLLDGGLGGFFRGRVDEVTMWLINVVWSLPTLLIVIAITFALGKGVVQVFIAVGLTMWVEVARVTRGQILSIRETTFVEAGRALGFRNARIIIRHIIPNILNPIIVISAANFATAILLEAGLSFLGIGVQPPMPSWGSMIKENYAYIILNDAYLAILPGIAIMLLVLAFMLMGNALREALNVKK